MSVGGEPKDPMAVIAEQTAKMLEEKRNKEVAKMMAKLMKNYNYDLLQGLGESDKQGDAQQGEVTDEMDMDELEMERWRKLQEMTEFVVAGGLGCREVTVGEKYESPLITKLRAVETVDELYQLADQIIPYNAKGY